MRLRHMLIRVEWRTSQNPARIENLLRELVQLNRLPPVSSLLIFIDHKNLMQPDIQSTRKPLPQKISVEKPNGENHPVKTWYDLFKEMGE